MRQTISALLNAAIAEFPDRIVLQRIALALTIGAIGGGLAYLAHVPLAFMLGSLFACMGASLMGAKVMVPGRLRSAFLILIGLFLGQSFDADAAARLAEWPLSIALAILYVPVAAAACYLLYVRLARLNRMTALFSSIPGGLSAVVLFSSALGADERRVALTQSLRVAIVVVVAPVIAFGLLGYDEPDTLWGEHKTLSALDGAILAICALVALWAFRKMGVPLSHLVAPLMASAALRIMGVIEGELPHWLVEVSLVVVGASIGARFSGAPIGQLAQLAAWTIVGTGLMLVISAAFALIASAAFDVDPIAALLAFAPGGVAEMCLIAIALDADPNYVAAHHLARIMFILLATPLTVGVVKRALGIEDDDIRD